jgi:hypothetical protein
MLRGPRRRAGCLSGRSGARRRAARPLREFRRRRSIVQVAALALVLGGCGAGGPTPGAEADPPPLDNVESEEEVETTIRVENRHWSDVTIYMFRRSARARIGIVTSNSTRTFQVPIGMGAGKALDVTLLADAIGSEEEYRTERLTVLSGQEVLLRLEVRMVHSSASVFWP